MHLPSFGLRTRLFALVLLAALPAFGLVLYSAWEQRQDARQNVQNQTLHLAEIGVVQQEQVVEGSRQLMGTIATLASGADLSTIKQEQCGPLFATLLKDFSFYSNVGIASASGDVVCSAAPLTGHATVSDSASYDRAVQTRALSLGDYEIDEVTGKPTVTIADPILGPAGELKGLMFVAMDLGWVNKQLASTELPEGATFSILDRNGLVLARTPDPGRWTGQRVPAETIALFGAPRGTSNTSGIDGVTRLIAVTPITGAVDTGLYAAVGIPLGTAYSQVNANLIRNLVGLGIAVALALAAAWIGGEIFVLRQTRALVAATNRLAQGDMTARSGLGRGSDEIHELARHFDEMAADLERRDAERAQAAATLQAANESLEQRVQERTHDLTAANETLQAEIAERRRTEEELDRFFNLSLEMICIAGFDGFFKRLNPRWQAVTGFTTHELLAKPYLEFVHPEDREATIAEASQLSTENRDTVSFENRYLCKDGSYKWLLWTATPLPQQELVYAVARDITERKQAEETIAEKAHELERSNTELEDFTHVVSHDLKEPLRGIEAFSGFLAEDYADKLDERGRRHLAVLQESAIRMRDLIDDLLQLSRIGRVKAQYVPVSIGALLAEIREAMAFSLNERNVDLRVQANLPTIVCDPVRIRQVFENLITNAVKYNPSEAAVVEIACVQDAENYTFSVRDNGPGIEPKYHEKIFRIFQRLVLRDEYEGTGVGLTICKKIVEGHGGSIWVDSDGKRTGSTFSFSIPNSIKPSSSLKEGPNGEQSGAGTHFVGGGQSERRGNNGESAGEGPGVEPAHSSPGRAGSA